MNEYIIHDIANDRYLSGYYNGPQFSGDISEAKKYEHDFRAEEVIRICLLNGCEVVQL